MDQVHVVRHKVLVEGQPPPVAREMGLSRNTVRRYLELPAPVRVERGTRPAGLGQGWSPVEALLTEAPSGRVASNG